jgi:hypothetical protein
MSVVAKDLRITLSAAEGVVLGQVRTHYPSRRAGSGDIEIEMPDMQSEETKTLLVEVSLPKLATPLDAQDLLHVNVAHRNVLSGTSQTVSGVVRLARPAAADLKARHPTGAPADLRVDRERNRLLVAEAIGLANDQAAVGGGAALARARATIAAAERAVRDSPSGKAAAERSASEKVTAAERAVRDSPSGKAAGAGGGGGDPTCGLLIADLELCLRGLRDERAYTSGGTHAMKSIQMAHGAQRCTTTSESTSAAYANSARTSMASAYSVYKATTK